MGKQLKACLGIQAITANYYIDCNLEKRLCPNAGFHQYPTVSAIETQHQIQLITSSKQQLSGTLEQIAAFA